MYAGKVRTGILVLILTTIGYLAFIIPGIFIHLIAVFLGYGDVRKFNAECLKTLRKEKLLKGPA
jgi:TM2 domain-containing membrane protein YozV